jgi:hypothetical protein
MDNFDAGFLGAVGIIVLIALLVLWFGFRVLFLPLRLSWRFGRSISQKIGPAPMTLVLIWTIAIAPEPFVYLWSWFLRLGKSLLVDVPRQATQMLTETPAVCSGSDWTGACTAAIGAEALQLWSNAMSQPVQSFQVPLNIERAALVFALGVTVAFVLTLIPSPLQSEQATRGNARTIAALVVSFLLAFYLAIISIIAIPVFGEKVPVIGPYHANLADQLKQEAPGDDIKYPMMIQMDEERHNLPDIDTLRHLPQLDYIESAWRDQIRQWDQSAERLHQSAASLPADAREFAQTTLSFFQVSNEGHIGEIATQRHVTVLANSFNLWIADYRAALDACAATLRDGLGRARTFYDAILPISRTAQENATPDQNNQVYQQLNQALQSFYFERCTDLKPVAREYLPARSGAVETLGPFGAAAAWLLRTESPELALIIGLLGFGFFGALAASFIREFAGTPRNELPAIGFILPALIRGVGAAILVFLLAKGGTAILTTGDASPNAYAIFFACFVAAVFSEDVWSWARSRQRRQFAEESAVATPIDGSPPATRR